MSSNATVASCLLEGVRRLSAASELADSLTGVLDAEVLLSHTLGIDRARVRSHPEVPVADEHRAAYGLALERRAAGEPIAYIVGYRDFWTLRISVNPGVLVPRPETELLVERALALRGADPARIVDLGTGSGAVALALAHERPAWHVTATDASKEALALARANAETHGLTRIELVEGSWFGPLAGRTFDLVLSNPPYVAADDPVLEKSALRFEPRAALTPGPDALECLRAIVHSAPDYLLAGGWLLLEHGAGQAADVSGLLVARGFGHVRSHTDLAGHERMTEGRWGRNP
ncbi:MAG: peptide chain release factor N(5)-glutamine methyltransferase [Gammaproteobacteria bacterium]